MRPAQIFSVWLENHIASAPPGTRLPTYAALARKWHISASTVRTLIGQYRDSDKLHSIPGRGTYTGQPVHADDAQEASSTPLSSVESIVDAFMRAINKGEFRHGDQLPPVKQMCHQFKVKPCTITHAYRKLVHLGYAEQIGKRYWIGDFRSLTNINARREVFFYCDNPDNFGKLLAESEIWQNVFTELESELTSCNVLLRLEHKDDFAKHMRAWDRIMRYPLGIIYSNLELKNADNTFSILKKLAQKAGPDRPQIIATSVLGEDIPDKIPHFCSFVHHGNKNTMLARAAAQYCQPESFQSIGYFCDRLIHCREAIRFMVELHHVKAADNFKIIVKLNQPISTIDELFAEMAKRKWTAEYLSYLTGKYGELELDEFTKRICFEQDFETAYRASPRRSLWLFMNPEAAAKAVRWCREERKKVPPDISIVGFGNAAEYLHYGISSSSIDWRALGYRLAHGAMGSIPIEKTRKGFFRISARFFERRTACRTLNSSL